MKWRLLLILLALAGLGVVVWGFVTGELWKWIVGLLGLAASGVLAGHSVIDETGKAAGFSPEPEVPGHPRRGPAGPISPPPPPDNPEEEPMHPSRRGSD